MKKVLTNLAVVLFIASMFLPYQASAQAPQKMSYQAVIRDASDHLVTSQSIGMRVSILQGSATGIEVYKEIYNPNPQTNTNGLVTIEIGGGIPITGTFSGIDWANGTYFIKTETDPKGGTNYTITGTSQLLSVPYAFYALGVTGSTPSGGIIMYSGVWKFDATGLGTGTLAGWALCNGNHGTPDLSDKFVMSTTNSTDYLSTGGTNYYTLTIAQLPSHAHTFTTDSAGGHSHTIMVDYGGSHTHYFTTNSAGSHSHTYNGSGSTVSCTSGYGFACQSGYAGYNYLCTPTALSTSSTGSHYHTGYIDVDGYHNHTASASYQPDHVHTGITDKTGSGSSIDNRPAYLKLAYIMKL